MRLLQVKRNNFSLSHALATSDTYRFTLYCDVLIAHSLSNPHTNLLSSTTCYPG